MILEFIDILILMGWYSWKIYIFYDLIYDVVVFRILLKKIILGSYIWFF